MAFLNTPHGIMRIMHPLSNRAYIIERVMRTTYTLEDWRSKPCFEITSMSGHVGDALQKLIRTFGTSIGSNLGNTYSDHKIV